MNKIDEKKKKLKTFNVKKDIKRALKNGAFIMLLALAVEAFTFKEPYSIVTGLFLLSFSFVFSGNNTSNRSSGNSFSRIPIPFNPIAYDAAS